MCAKEEMAADGIVRLSKVEVYPQYLDEYIRYVTEVGEISLRTEPGVLTMYAVGEKENPCQITILETYASREAYDKHIASAHFQKYKQGFSEIQARDAAHGQVVETNRPDTAQFRQPNQQLYKIIYSTHEKDTVFIIRSNND